jgi:CspA family cold shock protein
MQTWIVKFFNEQKNYWFITPDGGGKDLFFHGSKMKSPVKTEDIVTYEVAEWRRWPEAVEVNLIKEDDYE